MKCGFRGRVERHHVTYSPPFEQNLCHGCHVIVTALNIIKARSHGKKLDSSDRLKVWENFLFKTFRELDKELEGVDKNKLFWRVA